MIGVNNIFRQGYCVHHGKGHRALFWQKSLWALSGHQMLSTYSGLYRRDLQSTLSSCFPLSRWEGGVFSAFGGNEARHRRTVVEIVAQILGACHASAKKTALMYRCNMSFRQLTDYLDLMLGAQLLLIENNGSHLLFRTSGKGRDFLKAYESLKSLME